MTRRVYAVVTGRVQNVGFRYWALHRAEAQGLSGWVRNAADSRRVEIEVQGDDVAVEDLVRSLHEGPPSARVTAVALEERTVDPAATDFQVR
jgi:acylphosphatase